MMEHYADLLGAEGSDIPALTRSAYKTRTNYLLFTNRLGQVEKRRNQALKPLLSDTMEDVAEITEKIERASEMLRREIADKIFADS